MTDIRARAASASADRGAVGDVELGARERDDLVPGASAAAADVEPEHPGRAGDQRVASVQG